MAADAGARPQLRLVATDRIGEDVVRLTWRSRPLCAAALGASRGGLIDKAPSGSHKQA